MSRLVTLSRAARLVGISRGALQKRIRDGELSTFEGMIEVAELLRVYPQTKMEETAMLDRAEQIMERAVNKVVTRRTTVPDSEILAERVSSLGSELMQAKASLERQQSFIDEIEEKLFNLCVDGVAKKNVEELRDWFVDQRRVITTSSAGFTKRLAERDAFLRIIAADVKILPSGHEYLVEGSDSILDAGLDSGCNLNYGCSDGSCGLCKARMVSGKVKQIRIPGKQLAAAEVKAGNILMCCNTAVTDLVIEAAEASCADEVPPQKITARVKQVKEASENMAVVQLSTPPASRLRFLAGQYAVIGVAGHDKREVPIASCPCHETFLEFHIDQSSHPGLVVHLQEAMGNHDPVIVEGPVNGFTLQEDSEKPIICVAWENGFAPIKSLVEHAMALDITESIHLYWIAAGQHGHYMGNLCRSWSDALDEFSYTPTMLEEGDISDQLVEEKLRAVAEDYPDLPDFNVYFAGPERVTSIAEGVFLDKNLPRNQFFR